MACLKSGAVHETASLVRIEPINGPGICGADFPLKVAALDSGGTIGFADEIRPPGGIPTAGQPRWPIFAISSIRFAVLAVSGLPISGVVD